MSILTDANWYYLIGSVCFATGTVINMIKAALQ